MTAGQAGRRRERGETGLTLIVKWKVSIKYLTIVIRDENCDNKTLLPLPHQYQGDFYDGRREEWGGGGGEVMMF